MKTRFINKNRGTGKTMMMIHAAYVVGYPIIVTTVRKKEYLMRQAIDMGCNNIDVYTVEEWNRGKNNISHSDKVLVDDVDELLTKMINEYLNADVVAATLSLPIN